MGLMGKIMKKSAKPKICAHCGKSLVKGGIIKYGKEFHEKCLKPYEKKNAAKLKKETETCEFC